MLLKCDVSDAPGLASKLDGEDLSWSDIANAHDGGGEDAVHSLLNGLAKVLELGSSSIFTLLSRMPPGRVLVKGVVRVVLSKLLQRCN